MKCFQRLLSISNCAATAGPTSGGGGHLSVLGLRPATYCNRPISVYCFRRRALTLCPQLCMGNQPGARCPEQSADALPASRNPVWTFNLAPAFPRGALTLCPQLCMGIQPGARVPARSADALSATLYGHFTQAIYRNRPIAIARHDIGCHLSEETRVRNDYVTSNMVPGPAWAIWRTSRTPPRQGPPCVARHVIHSSTRVLNPRFCLEPYEYDAASNSIRGLHSFPMQLNLSSSVHRLTRLSSLTCPGVAQVGL
jgi:hypothetical protein